VKKGKILATINNRTNVTSPIDGVVLSLKVKKGESVTGNSFSIGTAMMIIADMSTLEIKADVGENDINKIHKNDSVDITVDAYGSRKFKGWVTAIPTSPKTSSGFGAVSNDVTEYEVRIKLDKESYKDLSGDDFPFRPGMNASADIKTKKVENVLAVPIGAVNARVKGSDKSMADKKQEEKSKEEEGIAATTNEDEDDLEEVVFVLQKGGTVKKLVVKSGIQDINYIEILSGLNEGDEVITDPYTAVSKTLKDGMKVKVVPKDKLFEK
jgi:HlyD family secretion protein